jgi:hypothetical protein
MKSIKPQHHMINAINAGSAGAAALTHGMHGSATHYSSVYLP